MKPAVVAAGAGHRRRTRRARPALALLSLGLTSAACAPPAVAPRCGSDEDCPAGYRCQAEAGYCWHASIDAAHDAAVGDAIARDRELHTDASAVADAHVTERQVQDVAGQDRPLDDAAAADRTASDLVAADHPASDGGPADAAGRDVCPADAGALPIAVDVSARTRMGQPVAIALLATDPAGQPLLYSVVRHPDRGSLDVAPGELVVGSQVVYTPTAGTRGLDSFDVVASAGCRASAPATVRVAVLDGDWWDARWTRRLVLALDNTARAESLIDLPVPLVLRDARVDLAQFAAGGADLRVVDASGQLLSHEVELWDASTRGTVWVRAPVLQASTFANLAWLYHGAAGVSSSAQHGAVWDDGFVAVWHLAGTGASALRDATVHALDVAQNDPGLGFGASGQLGHAVVFDGHGEPLELEDQALLDLTTSMTLEGLALPTYVTDTNTHYLIKKDESYYLEISGEDGYNGPGASVCLAGTATECTDTLARHPPALPETGRWYHVAATFGTNTDGQGVLQVYIDGVAQAPKTSAITSIFPSSYALLLGRDFLGRIDELRIHDVERRPAWIQAQAAALRDGMVHYGPVPWHSQVGVLDLDGTTAISPGLTVDHTHYTQWLVVVGLASGDTPIALAGLGLSWVHLARQCAATGTRALDLWQAEGYTTSEPLLVTTAPATGQRGVVGMVQVVGARLPHGPARVFTANGAGQDAQAACSAADPGEELALTLSSSERAVHAIVAVIGDGASQLDASSRHFKLAERSESSAQPSLTLSLHDVAVPFGQQLLVGGSAGGGGDWIAAAALHRP